MNLYNSFNEKSLLNSSQKQNLNFELWEKNRNEVTNYKKS